MKDIPRAFRLPGVAAATIASALFSAAAQADLITPITVQLVAPGGLIGDSTPLDLVQTLSAGTAGEITEHGTGQISSYMLDNDSISLSGNAIDLKIAGGATDGSNVVTGYLGSGGQHAYYEFDNLDIGASIASFTASGLSGLISPTDPNDFISLIDSTTTGWTLFLDLDNLVFSTPPTGTGEDFATVDITLNAAASSPTNPGNPPASGVPEPGSLACLAAAGLGLLIARRRARALPPPADKHPTSNE